MMWKTTPLIWMFFLLSISIDLPLLMYWSWFSTIIPHLPPQWSTTKQCWLYLLYLSFFFTSSSQLPHFSFNNTQVVSDHPSGHVLGYQNTLFQLYIFDSKEIRTILFWLCEFLQKDTFWGQGPTLITWTPTHMSKLDLWHIILKVFLPSKLFLKNYVIMVIHIHRVLKKLNMCGCYNLFYCIFSVYWRKVKCLSKATNDNPI